MGFLVFLWVIISMACVAAVLAKVFLQTVEISVNVRLDSQGHVSVQTSAENRLPIPKRLAYAFLLIGPESEPPVVTAQRVAALTKLKDDRNLHVSRFHVFRSVTNPLGEPSQVITDGLGRWLIPLPYYFNEHQSLQSEKLSYRCSVDVSGFEPESAYSVRFYVYSPQQPLLPRRLYRSTQDLIVLGKAP